MNSTHTRITLISLPAFLSLITLTAIFSCSYVSQDKMDESARHAQVAQVDSFGDSAKRVVYPKQNWSDADSLWFYNTSQGSNLLSYEIFLHLETAESEVLFRSDANMNRLRYLPQTASAANPDALPVGWVKNTYANKDYIGFTCAACHTGQVNYQGVAIRIDGGTTLSDMVQMLNDLAKSLQGSLDQPQKFERLAQKVLKEKYPANKEIFRAELTHATQLIADYNRINEPVHGNQSVAYGYARLDAFGRIYNRILEHLTPNEPNVNPANAPVSYPHLWDTPQHDFVQWNGVGDNTDDGALSRNVGEALGVFAHFELNKAVDAAGFHSSVNTDSLIRLENHLRSLWSPRWEELAEQRVLPEINQSLAEQGRQVYIEYQCHSCHEAIARTDPNRHITAHMASLRTIGTDPLTAMNALKYTGNMGSFTGQPINPHNPNSPRFAESGLVLPALSVAVAGVIAGSAGGANTAQHRENAPQATGRYLDFELVGKDNPAGLAAYKARPLNGIWATAPYLHNGSVPSLYELFMPSCSDAEIANGKTCRPNRFTLGVRELDPVKVGAVQRDPAQYPGLFVFDTKLPGNSNKGHEYAAGVTPVFILDDLGRPIKDAQGKPQMRKLQPINNEQRIALVEYLKTL